MAAFVEVKYHVQQRRRCSHAILESQIKLNSQIANCKNANDYIHETINFIGIVCYVSTKEGTKR
jgi:beta-N-acetylglucosaminidase